MDCDPAVLVRPRLVPVRMQAVLERTSSAMISKVAGLRLGFRGLLGGLAVLAACSAAARAGDGQVVHVGEVTELVLDGASWKLDTAASQRAHLVSVQKVRGSGASERYALRGLKTGQAKLVFRSGQKSFQAHIDVLQ